MRKAQPHQDDSSLCQYLAVCVCVCVCVCVRALARACQPKRTHGIVGYLCNALAIDCFLQEHAVPERPSCHFCELEQPAGREIA